MAGGGTEPAHQSEPAPLDLWLREGIEGEKVPQPEGGLGQRDSQHRHWAFWGHTLGRDSPAPPVLSHGLGAAGESQPGH